MKCLLFFLGIEIDNYNYNYNINRNEKIGVNFLKYNKRMRSKLIYYENIDEIYLTVLQNNMKNNPECLRKIYLGNDEIYFEKEFYIFSFCLNKKEEQEKQEEQKEQKEVGDISKNILNIENLNEINTYIFAKILLLFYNKKIKNEFMYIGNMTYEDINLIKNKFQIYNIIENNKYFITTSNYMYEFAKNIYDELNKKMKIIVKINN